MEQARAAAIRAEANRKRSEAAKEQHAVSTPRHGETMVVVPEEQVPDEAARAEDAGVSHSTMAKVECKLNIRMPTIQTCQNNRAS